MRRKPASVMLQAFLVNWISSSDLMERNFWRIGARRAYLWRGNLLRQVCIKRSLRVRTSRFALGCSLVGRYRVSACRASRFRVASN